MTDANPLEYPTDQKHIGIWNLNKPLDDKGQHIYHQDKLPIYHLNYFLVYIFIRIGASPAPAMAPTGTIPNSTLLNTVVTDKGPNI